MPNFIELRTAQDDGATSSLDEIAREGARRMLAQALEAEVADYIARKQERHQHGRAQVVRNGKSRPRKVTLGSGTIGSSRASGSSPTRVRGWHPPSLPQPDPAALHAPIPEGRRGASDPLPAWPFHRRLQGGPRRPARRGGVGTLADGNHTPNRCVAGRLRDLPEARSRGPRLRLPARDRRAFSWPSSCCSWRRNDGVGSTGLI
jgi:hypothetical protein